MRETAALIAEWEDLLTRRPAFRESLGLYGTVLEAWSRWSPDGSPVLRWGAEQCRERWERGVSLIVEAPPPFPPPPPIPFPPPFRPPPPSPTIRTRSPSLRAAPWIPREAR